MSKPTMSTTGLAGCLATVLIWAFRKWLGIDLPGEVAIAIGSVFGGLLVHGINRRTKEAFGSYSEQKEKKAKASDAGLLSIVFGVLLLVGCGTTTASLSDPLCGPELTEDGPQLCCRYNAAIRGSLEVQGQRVPLELVGEVAGCAGMPQPLTGDAE